MSNHYGQTPLAEIRWLAKSREDPNGVCTILLYEQLVILHESLHRSEMGMEQAHRSETRLHTPQVKQVCGDGRLFKTTFDSCQTKLGHTHATSPCAIDIHGREIERSNAMRCLAESVDARCSKTPPAEHPTESTMVHTGATYLELPFYKIPG